MAIEGKHHQSCIRAISISIGVSLRFNSAFREQCPDHHVVAVAAVAAAVAEAGPGVETSFPDLLVAAEQQVRALLPRQFCPPGRVVHAPLQRKDCSCKLATRAL